jgi:8-oxo-dGTP diphosphatase
LAGNVTVPFSTREQVIDVAAGLVFHQGRLLIAQRRRQDHLGGLWEFPGGKVEPGESFEQCLTRELREELGIEVAAGELIDEVTHSYPEKSVHLKFFKCSLLSGTAKALHCQDVAWITMEELPSFEFPAADAKLLKRLERSSELWFDRAEARNPGASLE